MNDPAYILSWDMSLAGDEGITGELVPYPGSTNVVGWKLTQPIEVPDRICFEANLRTMRRVDYPDNDVNWPIMSERMRSLLLPQAPNHRVIPVMMLDDTVPPEKRFDGHGEPRPGVAFEGFAAVQLLEFTDAMDMEQSEYTLDEDFPGTARAVTKLVLKDVPLPPLFRLSTYSYPLFVSRDARAALERTKIAGVEYWPLARIRLL